MGTGTRSILIYLFKFHVLYWMTDVNVPFEYLDVAGGLEASRCAPQEYLEAEASVRWVRGVGNDARQLVNLGVKELNDGSEVYKVYRPRDVTVPAPMVWIAPGEEQRRHMVTASSLARITLFGML